MQYLAWFVFQEGSTCCYFVVGHLTAKNLTPTLASAKRCHSSVVCNFPSAPDDIRERTADDCVVDIGDFRSIRMQLNRGLSKSSIGASFPAGTRSLLPALSQDSCEIMFPSPSCVGVWAELDLRIGQKRGCLILLSSPFFILFFRRPLFTLSICYCSVQKTFA